MSTAAILAGGRARRFGGQAKMLLPLGRQRIIDRLLAALGAVVDNVLIVMSAAETSDRDLFDLQTTTVVNDHFVEAGPLAGIHAALAASASPCTLIVAGDMPFLTRPFLAHLLQVGLADAAADAVIPRSSDGWHPLCACYRASCRNAIEERISRSALKTSNLMHDLRTRVLLDEHLSPYNPDGALLFNINTPADYARALAIGAYRADSGIDKGRRT